MATSVVAPIATAERPSRAAPPSREAGVTAWTSRAELPIWSEPTERSARLGYLRVGLPFSIAGHEKRRGPGCRNGYYSLLPRGYACSDSIQLGPPAPSERAASLAPRTGALPYSYALSNGVPMYTRLPSPAEWKEAERWLGAAGTFKRYHWNEKHERLTRPEPIVADGGPAPSVVDTKKKLVQRLLPLGSMLAYQRAFEHAGRVWLFTSDGLFVPADRVRAYRVSKYRGLELTGDVKAPLALFPAEAALYREKGETLEPSEQRVPARGWLGLDASVLPRELGGERYRAVRMDSGKGSVRRWLRERDASIVEKERGVLPAVVGKDEPWIHVSLGERLLVAYVGKRPVFATLVSPGAGGVPRKGQDHVKASTTPVGTFRIQYKHLAQTMSPDKGKPRDEWQFVFAEVPRAQYFEVPFALHTAYWHESFGEYMSGGCVNLSPEDGDWLFRWTSPALPEGWGGAWAGKDNGAGTRLVITR